MKSHPEAWHRWERLIADPEVDPLEVLRAATTFARYFAAVQGRSVAAARDAGHTWEEIAEAVGRTRQAVWQRFASSDPSASPKDRTRRAVDRSGMFLAPPPPVW